MQDASVALRPPPPNGQVQLFMGDLSPRAWSEAGRATEGRGFPLWVQQSWVRESGPDQWDLNPLRDPGRPCTSTASVE